MNRLQRLAWRVQRVVAKAPPGVFFLRGHPRSGTNWVGALLNLHPKICCKGEFHLDGIRQTVRRVQAQTWHVVGRDPVRSILDRCVDDMVRRCLHAVADKSGATILGDRTPHTLPGDGEAMVEGAPFIVVVRDGRDVLVSWRFHLLRQPETVIRATVPPPMQDRFLADAARFRDEPDVYASHPDRLLDHEEWVRHAAQRWANWVTHDRGVVQRAERGEVSAKVLEVRYEGLHADVEGGRRRMYEFLGLEPDEAGPVSERSRTTAGFGREDSNSFYRHGEVGDWKAYATDDATRWFKEAAGLALVELRYEKDLNW